MLSVENVKGPCVYEIVPMGQWYKWQLESVCY